MFDLAIIVDAHSMVPWQQLAKQPPERYVLSNNRVFWLLLSRKSVARGFELLAHCHSQPSVLNV
jgi:hypothetical protein